MTPCSAGRCHEVTEGTGSCQEGFALTHLKCEALLRHHNSTFYILHSTFARVASHVLPKIQPCIFTALETDVACFYKGYKHFIPFAKVKRYVVSCRAGVTRAFQPSAVLINKTKLSKGFDNDEII